MAVLDPNDFCRIRRTLLLGLAVIGVGCAANGNAAQGSGGPNEVGDAGDGSQGTSPNPPGAGTSNGQGADGDSASGNGATTHGGLADDESFEASTGAGMMGAADPGDGGNASGADASVGDRDGETPPGEGGADGPSTTDYGSGDGSDVVLMGDSWVSNTLQFEGTGGGIGPALVQVAGKLYRDYAVQGTMVLQTDSFGPAIPTQYEQARAANPNIKTVVMTGGINDIIQNAPLQSDCQKDGVQCKAALQQIGQILDTLWTKMAGDGVADIVYIRYSHSVNGVDASALWDAHFSTPQICSTGRVRCWSYESNTAVGSGLAVDGIHPLAAANQRIAKDIYAMMTQDGMRR